MGVNCGKESYLITFEDYVRISNDVAFVNHDGGTWAFRDLDQYRHIIQYSRIHVDERIFIGRDSTIMSVLT